MIDKDCEVHAAFPKRLQRPIEDYVDAFLYLGPGGLRLKEKMPGDVALDADYMKDWSGGKDSQDSLALVPER
jgi:hypothetical protein